MTTAEKLLVQIFERKNSIIERVKQQIELHNQHIASKLLIDGITPPPWFWNPNTSSAGEENSNELNKEELISKLLRPYQQPPHYPVYDNLVFRGDNVELSDGVFMENRAVSGRYCSIVPPLSREDQAGCALDCVPKPDISVVSPENQPDDMVVNICNAPDQSLSRIQRSKSRQKALQLRNSGTVARSGEVNKNIREGSSSHIMCSLSDSGTVARSGAVNKNIQDGSSSHIKCSLSATNWAGQDDTLLKSADPCVNGSQSCAEWNEKADSRSKEIEHNSSPCRIASSSHHSEVPDFVRGPLILDCSHENYNENVSSHISEIRTQSIHTYDSRNGDDREDTNLDMEDGLDASPKLHVEERDWGDEGKDKSRLVSCTPGSENLSASKDMSQLMSCAPIPGNENLRDSHTYNSAEEPRAEFGDSLIENAGMLNPISGALDKMEQLPAHESQISSCLEGGACSQHKDSPFRDNIFVTYGTAGPHDESSSLGRRFRHASMESWPQLKRRKFENTKTQSLTTSTSFRARRPQSTHREPGNTYLKNMEIKRDSDVGTFHVDKHTDIEIPPDTTSDLVEGVACAPSLGNESLRDSHTYNSAKEPRAESCEPGSAYLKNMEIKRDSDVDTFNVDKHTDIKIPLDTTSDLVGGVGCAPSPGNESLRDSHTYNSAKEPRAESCDSLIENIGMLNQICGGLDNMKQVPAQQSQISSCLEGGTCSQHKDSPFRDNIFETHGTVGPHDESSSLGRRFRHASRESWPQIKGRKIEHNKIQSLSTSASYGARRLQSTHREPGSAYLKNMEMKRDSDVDSFHVDKHTDIEIPPDMTSNLVEGVELTFSSQTGEVELCCKEKNEHDSSSSFINNEQLGSALVSSLKKDSMDSQGGIIEEISNTNSSSSHFDVSEIGDEHRSQNLCNLEEDVDNTGFANLSLTNTMLERIQQDSHSVPSPRTEDLEHIDVDQSMPELVGFIVDEQEDNGVLNFLEDGFDFDKLTLPSNAIERASMLAEICRSASLDKTSSRFSSVFEFQRNQSLNHSVPNGHLEDMDVSSSLSLKSDAGEQFQFGRSCVSEGGQALEGMPFSVSPAYSDERCGWNLRRQYTSPVGKLWERLSSHTGSSGSSEKRSNPELTCFPIEEDASISEGNKSMDENEDDVQEVGSSLAKHDDKRQPLEVLSNLGLKPSMSASPHETTLTTDFEGTKLSVTGAQDDVQPGAENRYRNKPETGEKQTSSIGASVGRKNQSSLHGTNGIKNAKKSINDSVNKSSLSIKTSLRSQNQNQKLSLKDTRKNNIISNVSSFVPLVQQKQASTVCAGKREVKVKALGAAEAAKRFEEKKENERKMKKEALKIERAKLEEKNLRQLELEKQKKEDERKKKNADIIAKKRQREEEERREKEKKRVRLEARHRQRGPEEKIRLGKAEKENRWSKDEQMKSKKELNESKKQQSREIFRGDDLVLRNDEECGSSEQSHEVGKDMHAVYKSPRNEDLIGHDSKGKSYEISPYQCSDDDEEDDELPTKKYIPSWASKSSIALLIPLQQEMDPDTIFPPGSFCSMDEVLVPRKLQHFHHH